MTDDHKVGAGGYQSDFIGEPDWALILEYNRYGQAFCLRHRSLHQEGYQDDQCKDHRELVYETNRDVKWICRMLQRMEAQDEEFERGSGRWRAGGRRRPARSGGSRRSAPGPAGLWAGWWRWLWGCSAGVRPEKLGWGTVHTMFPVHCYTPPEEYVVVEGHGVFALPFGPGLPGYSWGHAGCNRRETW